MSDRKPEEIWKTLEAQADEDGVDEVAAMSEEALDAELRAAGVDPEEVVKEARARMASTAPAKMEPAPTKTAPPSPPLRAIDGGAPKSTRSPKLPGSRAATVAWLTASAAAAATVATIAWQQMAAHNTPPPPPPIPTEAPAPPSPTPVQLAARARAEAFAACNVADWHTCTAKLDEAQRLDPSGETDPRVVASRAKLDELNLDNAKRPPPSPTPSQPPRDR